MPEKELTVKLYDLVTGDEDARVCKDIPEEACRHLPFNFFIHLLVNFFTKAADELASAKLLFPWVLSLLSAPALLIALCVPIREAGVLLPQLFIASRIREIKVRKYVWAVGSLGSGLTLLICAAILLMDTPPKTASIVIFACLLFFAFTRGVCSVASKDVMGKTVSKMRRGSLMGTAASLAGILTLLAGLQLGYQETIKSREVLLAVFFALGGLMWMGVAILITTIRETPGATEGGANGAKAAFASLNLLISDVKFQHYLLCRVLLLGVALSLPALVIWSEQLKISSSIIGMMLAASGLANLLSGHVWGRMADQSASKVFVISCSIQFVAVCGLFLLVSEQRPVNLLFWGLITAFFFCSVSLAGVRVARKTLLLDISTQENRASYTALSNTLIGFLILIAGAILGIFSKGEAQAMLTACTVLSVLAGLYSLLFLKDIQHTPNDSDKAISSH